MTILVIYPMKKGWKDTFENDVEMPWQTAYYFWINITDDFLNKQEEQVAMLLKEYGIEARSYYHMDEQYPLKTRIH